MTPGTKHDKDKDRWSLLPMREVRDVVRVMTFGAHKYEPMNWQKVKDPGPRYLDAAYRHLHSWWSGERHDPESGLPHLAHAVCCILFLMWFDEETGEKHER